MVQRLKIRQRYTVKRCSSTLGVRAIKTFAIYRSAELDLCGSLGWQHSLNDIESEQHLAFAGRGHVTSVESSALVRDAALVGCPCEPGAEPRCQGEF